MWGCGGGLDPRCHTGLIGETETQRSGLFTYRPPRMVQLLGARCIVCGMRPHVALTLIDMGLGLLQVETALNIEQAFDRIGNQPSQDIQ